MKATPKSSYYAYRVLVALNSQASLFDSFFINNLSEHETKAQMFKKAYNSIKKGTVNNIEYRKKYYDYYPIRELQEGVLLGKLSKHKEVTIHKVNVEHSDIEEVTVEDFPFSYVVLHLKSQAIIIQKHTAVFNNTDQASRIVEQMIRMKIQQFNATVNIFPITVNTSFWETYKKFEKVHKITLMINSPNLFLASEKAEEVAKEFNEETNSQVSVLEFRNDNEGLEIKEHDNPDEGIGKFIRYITEGGGKWRQRGRRNGKMETLNSEDNKKILIIDTDIESDQSIINSINEFVRIMGSDL